MMPDTSSESGLREQLAGWTAQGLIDEGQAARIGAAETARAGHPAAAGDEPGRALQAPAPAPPPAPVPAPAPRRLPLVAEALGYLGAVFAIVAGFIAVARLWPTIPASAELAFAGVAAAVLLLAGALLRTSDQPPFLRLRSVLWLTSAASLAAFAFLLTGPHFWHLGPAGMPLVSEAAATAYAGVLWWRCRATLQHLAVFAGVAALIGTAIAQARPGSATWGIGLGVWAGSLLWGVAVHRGYLVPRTAGYAAAGIGAVVGAQLTMAVPAGQALAAATVAGLLAAGVVLSRVLLLGLGAFGAVTILPGIATRYLPGGAGAAVAVFATGMVMLGVALWLAMDRKNARSQATAGRHGR